VPVAGRTEDREVLELLAGLKALLPELDYVDPVREDGVEEGGQVALAFARVGAQVEPGPVEPGPALYGGVGQHEGWAPEC
jgi:hypothetical protein